METPQLKKKNLLFFDKKLWCEDEVGFLSISKLIHFTKTAMETYFFNHKNHMINDWMLPLSQTRKKTMSESS